MKNFKIITLLIAGTIFMVSCGPQTSKEDQAKAQEMAEFDKKSEELRAKAREIFDKLPPATEVAARIQATGADFNGDLVNDPGNVDTYLAIEGREGLQAALVGIYISDMGYLSAYGQPARATFDAAQKLSDKLGVGRAFDEGVAIRYFEKIDQNEEAKKILNEAYANASKNLRTENRELISAAAATGVFIEGLYLLTSIVDTYPKDMLPDDVRNNILGPLVKGILEREATLDKLIEIDKALLEGVDNTQADFFLYDMEDLKASFAKLDVAGKMETEGASLVLNDETLAEITQKVASIREKIVVQ
ncbi:MAG: hypothetical protein O7F74_07980 [Bacteroidetes bacterium]|nr:hypothetical protein [Bacteroidota bacterium]